MHLLRPSSMAFRSRFSGTVRMRPQNTGRIPLWKVKAQSIQRSTSARAFRSDGHSVPWPCFAAR
jgi:hypothetical protein